MFNFYLVTAVSQWRSFRLPKGMILALFLLLGISQVAKADSGLYKDFVILNRGNGNQYYYTNLATQNSPFQGADLGTYRRSSSSFQLLLNGAEVNTYQSNGADMTGARLYYRVYAEGSAPGDFAPLTLYYRHSGQDNNPGNKFWDCTDAGVNILNLVNGTGRYVLEVYLVADGTYAGSTFQNYDSQNGSNYRATFTVTDDEGQVPDSVELRVLRQFFYSTNGDTWNSRIGWPITPSTWQAATLANAGTWEGVTVQDGDVAELYFISNWQNGVLPTSLGELVGLKRLTIYGGLIGRIPQTLGQLNALTFLYLSGNRFTNGIPAELGQLTHLKTLGLGSNYLSGSIPAELGKLGALTQLYLENNSLTGPIPVELGQLGQLATLALSYNHLDGSIPPVLGSLSSLLYLQLGGNELSGNIPAELGQLTQLKELFLYSNSLVGAIPPQLGALSALIALNLGNNHLTGTIPPELGQLNLISTITLENNQLTGTIPNELTGLINLAGLQLGNNQLSGAVPEGFGQLPQFTLLWLDNNRISHLPFWSSLSNSTRRQPNLFSLHVAGNVLNFADLEPHFTSPGVNQYYSGWEYAPQNTAEGTETVSYTIGEDLVLSNTLGGQYTHYQWQQQASNGTWLNLAGQQSAVLTIAAADATAEGTYRVQATNELAINLTLTGKTIYAEAVGAVAYIPPSDPSEDLDRNWILTRSFGAEEQVIGEGKQFSDAFGRPTQNQVKNLARKHVFASQTVYNRVGKGVLSTLIAPINNQEFKYRKDFISTGGATYQSTDFEERYASAPRPVDNTQIGTLGYYYSANNTLEPTTATTTNPFALVDLYEDPIGGIRRSAGPGDELRMGSHHEAQTRQFSLLNELDHYSKLRDNFVPSSLTPSLRGQGYKSVAIDVNGIESISFTNKDQQQLATCYTGDQYPASTLTFTIDSDPATVAPAYQEIHVPVSDAPTTITPTVIAACTFSVFNLLSGEETAHLNATPFTLAPGFYRFTVTSNGEAQFAYQVHYGDFSYSFYNDQGQLIATISPKGTQELLANGLDNAIDEVPHYVAYSSYDTNGHLLSTNSTDEGQSQFVYREDGSLRFSQNARQQQDNTFSYLNYDRLGRVVELGEYQVIDNNSSQVFEAQEVSSPAVNSVLQEAILENKTRSGGLNPTYCRLHSSIWYDVPMPDVKLGSRKQQFVSGVASKSTNGTVTSWYSYDELGRLLWMVQDIPVLGVKTVDYKYDFNGNVLEVAYQKDQPDAFYHHYQYNADQQLSYVYTSTDGLNKEVLVQYIYYLHGPLKRTVLGTKLQGVDYTYTVQGWLKGINQANKSLDPGGDSPKNNGIYKDLLGITLDYFKGDYASKQLAIATPDAANATTRYDGSIRSAAWATAANSGIYMNAYRYDGKNQLLQSDFGTLDCATNNFQLAANKANEEGGLQYDSNGNLERLHRRDNNGTLTDNFNYHYAAGTNQLMAVHNQAGEAVLDYDYDATGRIIRQRDEQGFRYVAYNLASKVTGEYHDEAHQKPIATFTYDDRGFRASKASYSTTGQLLRTTYYVRDLVGNVLSTYEQAAARETPPVRSEVPLYGSARVGTLTRQDDGSNDVHYELDDHLGTARVIFHKPKTASYVAGMEDVNAQQEEQEFTNIDLTRYPSAVARTGRNVARLNVGAGLVNGPSKAFNVEKGDTITFSAYAWLPIQATAQRSSLRVLPFAASTSNPPTSPISTTEQKQSKKSSSSPLTRLAVGVGLTGWNAQQQAITGTGSIQAWLHYRLLDADGKQVDEGYQYADASVPEFWQKLLLGVRVQQAGRVELSIATDSPGSDIYFDDIDVEHTGGMILQEQHTYAYGAPLIGLNYQVGSQQYRHSYQGQFAENDKESSWSSFEYRTYDSRIGRWLSTDLVKQNSSPYAGMGNNPISFADPDGKDVIVLNDTYGASGAGHMALLVQNREKGGWDLYSKNGTDWPLGFSGPPPTTGHAANQVNVHYASLEDFYTQNAEQFGADASQYDRALLIKTTAAEDEVIRYKAEAVLHKPYHVLRSSCQTTVQEALGTLHIGFFWGSGAEGFNLPNENFAQLRLQLQRLNDPVFSKSFFAVGFGVSRQFTDISPAVRAGIRNALNALNGLGKGPIKIKNPRFR